MNRGLSCTLKGEDFFESYKKLIGDKARVKIEYFDKYVKYYNGEYDFVSFEGCLNYKEIDYNVFQILLSLTIVLAVIFGLLFLVYKMRQENTEDKSETTTDSITTSLVFIVIF